MSTNSHRGMDTRGDRYDRNTWPLSADAAAGGRVRMDPTCFIDAVEPLWSALAGRVVGQDEAVHALICSFSRLLSGLHDASRPLLTGLLLGPTGVGKTETAKALAQALFGSERALTRVNCEEYAHGHELSKLLGSPPGYVGHNIEPLLSQARIEEPHRRLREKGGQPGENAGLAERILAGRPNEYLSVILFDEIEKAHPLVWSALLGVLEDGMLTLGDNTTTDFTRSVVLMTSNVGSREMGEILERRPVGFRQGRAAVRQESATLRDLALAAARQNFPFEFLNRFDEILVYSSLERQHLERILDKVLADVHQRTLQQARVPLLIKVSPEAKQLIIERGSDLRFGARPLRRAVERELVDPLSRFIASNELHPGDLVEVDVEGSALAFYRGARDSHSLVV